MAKPGSSRGKKSEGGEKKQAKPSDVRTSGPTMRTRKRKSVVEEVENPEKSRLENIHKKDSFVLSSCVLENYELRGIPCILPIVLSDFIVVQFPDKMALTLDMKAVTTTKKWDVDDGVSYGESLATGDQIVVRHLRKMDAKQQSSKAKFVIITASKAEAEGLQKTLDEQARKAMNIAPKKPSDGQHEDEAWVSESAEVEQTERSASPQLQLAQTLDREYARKPRSPNVESRCWLFNPFTGSAVKREHTAEPRTKILSAEAHCRHERVYSSRS
ncbi:hypothetical protein RvY_04245-2 [Ramazzottius varieornatus]|uniref:Uncharacterized protein n=1 Tax=Ramazzottius varieornatus TaxID=947166 RepID=A0A1D1V0A8_RAMVA|nr:hypothetical protein RvY_04245-2 [Ramazzottius varieornatus]